MIIVPIICFILAIIIIVVFQRLDKVKLIKDFDDELKYIKKNRNFFNKNISIEDEERTLIGNSFNQVPIYTDDNAKHIFVCGTTGSGKTVALTNYIKRAIDKDFPLLILDGKGDIGSDSLLDIVKRLKGNRKLYVIDMNKAWLQRKFNQCFILPS